MLTGAIFTTISDTCGRILVVVEWQLPDTNAKMKVQVDRSQRNDRETDVPAGAACRDVPRGIRGIHARALSGCTGSELKVSFVVRNVHINAQRTTETSGISVL